MRELALVRDEVARALREAGLTAFAAWPPERMRDYGGAVAAVDVGGAESGPMGFCNYLGQTYDEALGTVREVYGKQLEAEILVDLRATRAAECEAACAQTAPRTGRWASGGHWGGTQGGRDAPPRTHLQTVLWVEGN